MADQNQMRMAKPVPKKIIKIGARIVNESGIGHNPKPPGDALE
jgi:hypothetical protein